MPFKNKNERRDWLIKRSTELREMVGDIAESYGCQLCPEKDRVALDFHHYDAATKEFGIGDAIVSCYAWKRIEAEIPKCIVLCANCHRKVHAGKLMVTENMKCDIGGSSNGRMRVSETRHGGSTPPPPA